jgi:transposase
LLYFFLAIAVAGLVRETTKRRFPLVGISTFAMDVCKATVERQKAARLWQRNSPPCITTIFRFEGMPPKAHLAPHLTVDELKRLYRQAQDATEARRWHLLHLISQQWTIKRAASVVDLNYDYAKEIVRRYNREGPSAIKNRSQKRQPSPRSLLTPDQQQELRHALKKPPPEGGEWTGPKVARWMSERTDRPVWPQRGWDYLKKLKS